MRGRLPWSGIIGPGTFISGEQEFSGYSSEVEPQPSKLVARVRFPLPAPFSIPHTDWNKEK